jgi:hypothetical protein
MKRTNTLRLIRSPARDYLSKRIEPRDLPINDPYYLLNEFEEIIHSIPITDLRYRIRPSLRNNDILEDMVLSSEVTTSRKDITTGILDLTINFVSNLDEIERYNKHVENKNKELLESSYEGILFDPVHGKMKDVTEESLTSINLVGDDRVSHKSYLLVRYQIRQINSGFVLGYSVYDHSGMIIYFNEISSKNLMELCYRSVQEIWGHPEISGSYTGSGLIEGVQYLINGKKLSICKRDNRYPSFINEIEKDKGEEVIKDIRVKSVMYSFTGGMTGTFLPIIFCFLYLISCILCIYYMGSEDYYMELFFHDHIKYGEGLEKLFYLLFEVSLKLPMLFCIGGLIGTLYFRKVTQNIDRNRSEFTSRSKLL